MGGRIGIRHRHRHTPIPRNQCRTSCSASAFQCNGRRIQLLIAVYPVDVIHCAAVRQHAGPKLRILPVGAVIQSHCRFVIIAYICPALIPEAIDTHIAFSGIAEDSLAVAIFFRFRFQTGNQRTSLHLRKDCVCAIRRIKNLSAALRRCEAYGIVRKRCLCRRCRLIQVANPVLGRVAWKLEIRIGSRCILRRHPQVQILLPCQRHCASVPGAPGNLASVGDLLIADTVFIDSRKSRLSGLYLCQPIVYGDPCGLCGA